MQVGPVRWIFIKSPINRQPYTHIRRFYELELANTKAKHLSELEKTELLLLREKTKRVMKQKKRKELIGSIIILVIILLGSTLLVYFLIK